MDMLKTVLTVLFIIVCIVLLVLVLLQEGKDAGLGSMYGSAPTGTYWSQNKGRSKKARIIQITTLFTVLFFVLTAILCSRLF
ncbi:MAG: preprotein translocase subunit SecG [Lachnospiraceae bacterium]|nr:preprotein translocase subunit SecG [Lachnospiraceae bacterium]